MFILIRICSPEYPVKDLVCCNASLFFGGHYKVICGEKI